VYRRVYRATGHAIACPKKVGRREMGAGDWGENRVHGPKFGVWGRAERQGESAMRGGKAATMPIFYGLGLSYARISLIFRSA
jgi:hypothetical protein